MKKYRIAREVREQILNRVKNEGISVTDAATEHGVNPTTIYEWLKDGAESGASALEVAKLRRENQELKLLVADMLLKLSEAQKKK
jgi:transposase-like protein